MIDARCGEVQADETANKKADLLLNIDRCRIRGINTFSNRLYYHVMMCTLTFLLYNKIQKSDNWGFS